MIYLHEISRAAGRGVRGVPVVGGALNNPILLSALICVIVISLAFYAIGLGDRSWRELGGLLVRAFVYAIFPVMLLVYWYGTGVEAETARVYGGSRMNEFMAGGVEMPPPEGMTAVPSAYPPQSQPAYPSAYPAHPAYPPTAPRQPAPDTLTQIERM